MAPMSVKVALRGGQTRKRHADQREVWDKVSRLERTYGVKQTNSLHELMTDTISRADYMRNQDDIRENAAATAAAEARAAEEQVLADVRAYARNPLPGQRGIIIGIGGVPVSMELFASTASLRAELLPTLMAALVDAGSASKTGVTRGQAARDFAAHCARLSADADWVPGDLLSDVAEAVRGGSEDIDVRGLRRSDTKTLLHFSAVNMKHELAMAF